jgi:CHAD domain-containing protein
MTFALDLSEDVPIGVRRLAREQLDDAVRLIGTELERDPVTAVHDARKALKRTRCLLRLAQRRMGRGAYRREQAALREIGRALSASRDADVMVGTVDKLAERYVGQLAAPQFEALRKRLVGEAEVARATTDGQANRRALAELRAAAKRADAWPLDDAAATELADGAARAYARGRRAMRASEKEPTAERFHDWRKRVQDLRYQSRALQGAWPRVMRAQAKEAHALADLLGDEHDLAVLSEKLESGRSAAGKAPIDVDAVRELIEQRRAELRAAAHELGRRLYAEAPKAFARRLRSYLKRAPGRTEAVAA